MKRVYRLEDMTKGWFVGDFAPTALKTSACEFAIKSYAKGDAESRHYHAVAQEVTVIISGNVLMDGVPYRAGDIIVLDPGDQTDFEAVTDAVTAVVKLPSVMGDKFPA